MGTLCSGKSLTVWYEEVGMAGQPRLTLLPGVLGYRRWYSSRSSTKTVAAAGGVSPPSAGMEPERAC